MPPHVSPNPILQLGFAYWGSKTLLSARRQNAFGLLMSLNMLIETSGGFNYTGADGTAWMREEGFRTTRVEHLVGPDSIVVGLK